MSDWQSDEMFLVYFNRRRSWLEVHLWAVHPTTFSRWAKTRWGYFLASENTPKEGKFGEIHFVKSRVDRAYQHELEHARNAWWWYVREETLTMKNEEAFVVFNDELKSSFEKAWLAYRRRDGMVE